MEPELSTRSDRRPARLAELADSEPGSGLEQLRAEDTPMLGA